MKVKVRVPATTANLGPGFDIFGLALTLYNVIEMEIVSEQRNSVIINIEGEGKGSIPSGERAEENIIYKAARIIFDKSDKKHMEVRLHLMNTIPLARGLGSSAAAIVGGLIAANELCDGRYNKNDIFDFAMELEGHPDNVGAAVYGGLFACLKFKSGIEKKSIKTVNFKVVACIPDFEVSTEQARKVLPDMYKAEDMKVTASGIVGLTYSFLKGDTELLQKSIESDYFHQPYRVHLVKEKEGVQLEDVFKAAKEHGALGVALSGSGPTVVAFYEGESQHHEDIGKAMEEAFLKFGKNSRSLYLEIDNDGAQIIR